MVSRILIQGLFHGIWTRLYTTVMPGIPKGGTVCPQLHLGLAWEGPCLHQEGIQPWNDLLKRNQLMASHAMTSSSGSSNIFPRQMQQNHCSIPLSTLQGDN